ncbi:MAG: tetratricopeptide repeat protein [Deltaproteobacteria bacterium]|nr:tetratricopeptide repeat protein [Deltaproteobacteria bacterium]
MPEKKEPPPKIPRIFDRNPELKKRVEAYLAKIPREKKEEDMRKFEKFVAGEMTWAEIRGYPKTLLKELARMAYLKFKIGDFKLAESLFKGLSVIDHANWYYRAVLGAVYQKQKLYEQAIEEYNVALSLNESEVTSLTNRGECHLHLQNTIQARKDFEAAVRLDPDEKNSWGKRARVLLKKLKDEGRGEGLEEDSA